MNILIIYTYPNHQSFNDAILKVVQQNLSKDHNVNTLDLYEEQFNPILRFDDTHKRRDLSTVPDMEKYRNLITWADHFIFIYPIWWSGMPAMLKGFIDRVFTAGFAYSYGKRGLIGHLQGKSAWIITTHNTPAFLTPFIQDYGKVLKNQVLKSCGIKPVTHTQLAGTENSSDEKRRRFLDKIANIAGSI